MQWHHATGLGGAERVQQRRLETRQAVQIGKGAACSKQGGMVQLCWKKDRKKECALVVD